MARTVSERPVAPGASERSTPYRFHAGRTAIAAHLLLVLLCLATRLATTIRYVEDPDSLHFALSMIDFDVARLQPHFPGYVVFVALGRLFTMLTGSFALGFSLVGALATYLVVTGVLSLMRWELASPRGSALAIVVLTSGMLWVYANRYMPDLLGVAMLVWALRDLTAASDRSRVRGAFVAGLLAGTRLSYMPFLIPAAIGAFAWRSHRITALGAFVLAVALWSLPLVASAGLDRIVAVAANQTAGHFDEFGGTIRTEPDLGLRLERIVEGLWSDGLAGYMPGRTALTIIAGTGTLVAVVAALPSIAALALRRRRGMIVVAGAVAYFVWIFLYQNIVHHSRHLLPFMPLLLAAAVHGASMPFARIADARGRIAAAAAAAAVIAAAAIVGTTIAFQHTRPTAIAQVRDALVAMPRPLTVVSTGLVNTYLVGTGVRARFIAVEELAPGDSIGSAGGTLVSVGDYRSLVGRPTSEVRRFHHNPHVNRIWPTIELYRFASGAVSR